MKFAHGNSLRVLPSPVVDCIGNLGSGELQGICVTTDPCQRQVDSTPMQVQHPGGVKNEVAKPRACF